MAADTSKRSNLVDVTYQALHQNLSGHLEGTTLEQLADIIKPRVDQLRNISEPFGRPSDASKKNVDSGSVTLPDGVVLRVEDADKEVVFTISKKLDIDQVQALILLRSFLYNEGLPEGVGADSSTMADELVEAITPFYYSERLHILRTLIPLFRAEQNAADPVHEIASEFLPKIIPDGCAFAETLLGEYISKTHAAIPEAARGDTRQAATWAKQNAKEQLVMLEVLFWTMWSYATCNGPLVAKIYETAYETHLGSQQQNSTFLLDEESVQILQDCAALWILITVEVLELERVAGGVEVSADPMDKDIYWASPDSLKRIHHAVISQGNSNFACTYIAWTFVLARISRTALELKEIPNSYKGFFDSLIPQDSGGYSKDGIRAFELMAKIGLGPDAGLFRLMLTLLTTSPLFVTSVAWRTGSSVTDPNAVAYRSVLKGLVIAIVELVPVELIPDFDGLLEVWVALFGRSEPQAVAGICRQFWEADWYEGIARRAIVDVARSRFPVQVKPLIRLLRALTATGFLETDPLSTADHIQPTAEILEERQLCTRAVFDFFDELSTYTQVIHTSSCIGAHALYEKLPDRYGSSSATPGPSFMNLRPIRLPGGSVLPAKTIGQLLSSDGGDVLVVSWQHKHSGWKLLLELLTDYVNRRRMQSGTGGSYRDVSFGNRGANQPLALKLEDVGVEMDRNGDESIIIDALDLIRSVVHDNQELAQQLLVSMESGDPVVSHTMTEVQPPDLVQLTTAILEDALTRSANQHHAVPRTNLITSAMSVLTALLAVPNYSNRVWLYIRSSSSLFGSDRSAGVASSVLAAERLTGHYTMTLALLHLVEALFTEASATVLLVMQQNPKLQQVKEEVLMRAARFVHSEIWVEHMGWKYAQLGDRFEIGRRVSMFYMEVFKHSSPALKEAPFAKLSHAIADALLFKATTSTVNPLVATLVTGGSVMNMLYASRRYGDARRLVYLLESHLALTRTLLTYKQKSPGFAKICLLEQALCSRVGGGGSFESGSTRADPVDALAAYVKERSMGDVVPVAAMQVLFALCSSLSSSEGSASTIIGHLSDPEATVSTMVRIVQHPYDDALLRNAVWNFITLAVDKEPALARLFVTGRFRLPSIKGKEKAEDSGGPSKAVSALSVACEMLESWKELWELNPKLLASLLRFLDVVWQHGHEHKSSLDPIRDDGKLFDRLAAIVAEELGPNPDCVTEGYILTDGVLHSDHHEAVSTYCYRSAVKSHAAHILGADIRMYLQSQEGNAAEASKKKPRSYTAIEATLRSEEQISELIPEASTSAYRPELHDEFTDLLKRHYPTLSIEHLQAQEPIVERDYGDDFAFSMALARLRLNPYASDDEVQVEDAIRDLHAINMNLSLAHVQTALAEAWQFLLLQVVPYLRGDPVVRTQLLSLADSLSVDIADEQRSGEMMSNIHCARISLLLSLLEIAWFSTSDKKAEVDRFIALVKNVKNIIINNAQPPAKSILGQVHVPFHRPLLQILYYCARQSRSLARRPKLLTAEHRLAIAALLDATLVFVVDGLRVTFDRARLQLDLDVDQDMELLVAVFEQCTRPDLNPSPTLWLTRCQETDVVRASLQLFSSMDIAGLSDVALLRSRKQPLYTPHVLTFHMAMASIPPAAERLASEGLLVAYIENAISVAIRDGNIDVTIPELPGEESPAHRTYCAMLAIIAGVSTALGRHGQFFESEVCGLLQFYSEQIHRALSWTIDDPLSLPLLEEIEQVVNLFGAIAQGTALSTNDAVKRVMQFFTSDALLLLQQLNYALTHPNHLASLFEPITAEERTRFEADRGASSVKTPSEAIDPMRRPFLARLVHRLYRLSGTLLSALIDISGAENVLLGEPEDWQVSQALIVPHSKVVLGEPASLGTLLEIGNSSLDILRLLVDRPPAQALTPATSSEKALDVRDTVAAARRNLEAALLYAVTQLAMWLSKPEFDAPSGEADPDSEMSMEGAQGDMAQTALVSVKERRGARKAMTLAERLRRGMTGEMAADLQGLLGKAKPVIAKSASVLGEKEVDLTQVLSYFVQERISMPA